MENELQQTQNTGPGGQLSLIDAISGTFTSPGYTFETIESTPKKNYWLISIIICVVFGLISSFIFLNDTELVDKVMDKQKQKIYKAMDENVKSGKMSKEESDKAVEQAEKFMNPKGLFFQISAYGGSVVVPFITMLIYSLIAVIIIKILKGGFLYLNILNVISLAMIISAVGDIINNFISVMLGDLSSVSLALALRSFEIPDNINIALTSLNVFKIWSLAVMSIGIAKAGKVKTIPVMVIIFVVVILYTIITSFLQ